MRLLLECLPDETLVRQLGLARRDCLHLNDKGRVCNRLKKTEGLTAMVDDDPGAAQPAYLQELRAVSDEHGVRILRDERRAHVVIVLQPRLEEWIIRAAVHAQIAPKAFGLSERGNELHKEINFRLHSFVKLIEALASAKSPGLARLSIALRADE